MRRKKLVVLLLVSAGITLLAGLIWAVIEAEGTGFGDQQLWDWMELLILPAALGIGAWWFNSAERKADREIADDRLREDHAIALNRQRETILSTYFDRMSDLLFKDGLLQSEEDTEVRSVARASTISAFASLDGERIARVIRFLSESGLSGQNLLHIELPSADLKGVRLENTDLGSANLLEANLQMANLGGACLQWAHLSWANLRGASLLRANLQGALLNWANLQMANLLEANLQMANLGGANLQKASLGRANLQEANLFEANLRGASLLGANLQGALLNWANLQEADLRSANLQGASLERANLRRARVTPEQLSGVKALEGAIMPDGTKYEDWLAKGSPAWSLETDELASDEAKEDGSESRNEA